MTKYYLAPIITEFFPENIAKFRENSLKQFSVIQPWNFIFFEDGIIFSEPENIVAGFFTLENILPKISRCMHDKVLFGTHYHRIFPENIAKFRENSLKQFSVIQPWNFIFFGRFSPVAGFFTLENILPKISRCMHDKVLFGTHYHRIFPENIAKFREKLAKAIFGHPTMKFYIFRTVFTCCGFFHFRKCRKFCMTKIITEKICKISCIGHPTMSDYLFWKYFAENHKVLFGTHYHRIFPENIAKFREQLAKAIFGHPTMKFYIFRTVFTCCGFFTLENILPKISRCMHDKVLFGTHYHRIFPENIAKFRENSLKQFSVIQPWNFIFFRTVFFRKYFAGDVAGFFRKILQNFYFRKYRTVFTCCGFFSLLENSRKFSRCMHDKVLFGTHYHRIFPENTKLKQFRWNFIFFGTRLKQFLPSVQPWNFIGIFRTVPENIAKFLLRVSVIRKLWNLFSDGFHLLRVFFNFRKYFCRKFRDACMTKYYLAPIITEFFPKILQNFEKTR